MNTYSKNKKLNAVLKEIESDLLSMRENERESIGEIERYMCNFPFEIDYNLYQYGNVLIYYYDIRKLYKDCGYKTADKWSNEKMIEIYKRQVGYVARCLYSAKID